MQLIQLFVTTLRILLRVTRPYSLKFLDIIYRFIFGPKLVLPPIDNEILLMSAVELANKIRKNQLKSEDVLKAYIKRIKEVDPVINAVLDQRFEEALKEAREVDNFISSGVKSEEEIAKETPLLGVPFSAKECVGVKGMAQINGCYKYKDRKAEKDGAGTALYKKAGAISLTVTNISEYVMFWDTVNCFGRTFNPYYNVRSAGGSSGGEAALLAYGGSVVGIGSDLEGSIRVPAAFNGVYAHNSSPGMISKADEWPPASDSVDSFLRTGPLCRYAKDLPLLASVLSEGRIKFQRKIDFGKVKFYYMEQFPGYLLEPVPDIKEAIRMAAEYFDVAYNNKPREICIPELKYTSEIMKVLLVECDLASVIREITADVSTNILYEFIKVIFGISKHTLPTLYLLSSGSQKKDKNYYKYLAMFDILKSKLDYILDDEAVLLIPTHPEPAVHHLMTIPKLENKAYTRLINFLGYPATQIPAGFSDGLPIGMQIICKTNNDYLCISTAMELEKLFGGWKSPSEITV